jgi:hypothetical protein
MCRKLRAVDHDGHAARVGQGNDRVERRKPAADIRSSRDREEPRRGGNVEGLLDGCELEGSVGTALDET